MTQLSGNWRDWPVGQKLAMLRRLRQIPSPVTDTPTSPHFWTPLHGPQRLAYDSTADVLGYGGAAGGGKSDLLLGLAVNRHRNSLILRREAVQTRALVDRSREIIGVNGRLNTVTGVWRLYDSRQIELAGCANPGDEQKYRGRPHDLLAFDEADQFPEHVVRFLSAWIRTTDTKQPCRLVLCFNPPATAEGRWVLSYFSPWVDPKHPRPAMPGELRWYATLADGREVERPDETPFEHNGEVVRPRSRTFVPARVKDNPYLTATDYVRTLQALPEPLRSQLLYGDMTAGLEDDPWQAIPTAWVVAAQSRWTDLPPEGQPLTCVGCDVARGGRDYTVVVERYGWWFKRPTKFPGSTTPDGPTAAARVLAVCQDADVNVDVIGIGAAVYDHLRPILRGRLHGVNNAEKSEARDKSRRFGFHNVRAASYWQLREALDPDSGCGLALPPDPELLADLTAPRYEVTARGIKLEDKEEIIKRIGRSPDVGDAVVLAHFHTALRRVVIG